MQAVAIQQVDGERGADPGQQHLAVLQRRQQGEEAIHAEVSRISIGDTQACAARLRAHQVDSPEARAQRIQQGHPAFARCHAGDAGGIAARQSAQPAITIVVRDCADFAQRSVRSRFGGLQARVAEIEQPGTHARTLTSPACTIRSRPSPSRTRKAPSAAMPSAVAGHAPLPSCMRRARPDKASSAA